MRFKIIHSRVTEFENDLEFTKVKFINNIVKKLFPNAVSKYYSHHMDLEIEGEHTMEVKDYLQISNVFYLVTDIEGNRVRVRSSNKLLEKPRIREAGTHFVFKS